MPKHSIPAMAMLYLCSRIEDEPSPTCQTACFGKKNRDAELRHHQRPREMARQSIKIGRIAIQASIFDVLNN